MKKQPNILWLCTDQQRYDTIHALGNEYIDTPNLDRLCREGVAFTRAYCQNPVCTPSRASFLSGKYPSAINANMLGARNHPEHCTLITKALADAGYHCGNIGKLHISTSWGGHEERTDDGYAEFYYNLGSGHHLEHPENAYAAWLKEKGVDWHTLFTNENCDFKDFYCYREDAPVEYRQTAWCADQAIRFIEANQARPWLLTVNCFDPHPPYDAPAAYVEKYLARRLPEPIFSPADLEQAAKLANVHFRSKAGKAKAPDEQVRRDKASYYGMCEIIDLHFGQIIDALDRLGLREDTVIVFTSDHGEMLGDHGLQLKGCRFYEGAVRVPLIFSCPGWLDSGKTVQGLTELTDIAPTLAEICGVDFPDTVGHSLLPALRDCGRAPYQRDFVRCEYYNSNNTVIPTYADMYRDERYKFIVYHTADTGELYDLQEDPREEHNLWDDPAAAELRFRMLKRCFDLSAIYSRPGQERIGRY